MWSGFLAASSLRQLQKVCCWLAHFLGLSVLFPWLFAPKREPVERSDAVAQTEHFPLLSLPSELIVHVFSYLRTRDRHRARVCRQLAALEASEAYYAERVIIASERHHFFPDTRRNPMYKYVEEIQIRLAGDRSSAVESIRKVASNVTPMVLQFKCDPARDLAVAPAVHEIPAQVKSVVFVGPRRTDIEEVFREYSRPPTGNELINDTTVHEWIGEQTRFFRVLGQLGLTGEGLHRLFTEMEAGRHERLLTCYFESAAYVSCTRLLELIGITKTAGGQVHSTRADVDIYVERLGRTSSAAAGFYLIVVGSRMKITCSRYVLDSASMIIGPSSLSIERHNADGTVPEHWRNRYSFYLDIQDIRNSPNRFERQPITYADDNQQPQQ